MKQSRRNLNFVLSLFVLVTFLSLGSKHYNQIFFSFFFIQSKLCLHIWVNIFNFFVGHVLNISNVSPNGPSEPTRRCLMNSLILTMKLFLKITILFFLIFGG